MTSTFRACLAPLGLTLALAACSQQGGSGPAAPAAAKLSATDAAAARDLETYRELVRIHNDEMASTMGRDIVDKYPDSAAAREVQQTLPAITKRYKENREKARLAGLWLYQVSPMAGGTQSTAVIENSQPIGTDRVRLVLRRHTEWGLNAFLYGSGGGFVCRRTCTLPATFDGKATGIKAFAPTTGEPALMIKEDKAFIAQLKKAKTITVKVRRKDNDRTEDLVYEVAGFDPAKWLPVDKRKKK